MGQPLMPKATAVWLVENTALSFEQIAEFCNLHSLEVQAIADGEVGTGIQGLDPIANGELTQEEIDRCSGDPGTWPRRARTGTARPERPAVSGPSTSRVSRRLRRAPARAEGTARAAGAPFAGSTMPVRRRIDRPEAGPSPGGSSSCSWPCPNVPYVRCLRNQLIVQATDAARC